MVAAIVLMVKVAKEETERRMKQTVGKGKKDQCWCPVTAKYTRK
jgi:hypothetical protein